MTDDFFRNRLDQMIDLRHPLAVLASCMPWLEIEVEAFAAQAAWHERHGHPLADIMAAPGSASWKA